MACTERTYIHISHFWSIRYLISFDESSTESELTHRSTIHFGFSWYKHQHPGDYTTLNGGGNHVINSGNK